MSLDAAGRMRRINESASEAALEPGRQFGPKDEIVQAIGSIFQQN